MRQPHPTPLDNAVMLPGQQIVHECSDCGLMSRLSDPIAGTDLFCGRCGNILRRVKGEPLWRGMSWTICALFCFLLTVIAPLMQVSVLGETRSGSMFTGPQALDAQGFWLLGSVVVMTTILMPLIKIVGTIVVLAAAMRQRIPDWTIRLYALLKHISPWVMIEVYSIGLVVAYSRLTVITHVHLAVAIAGLIGLMLSIIAMDAVIDPESIWEKIGKRRTVDVFKEHNQLIGCDTCYQVSEAGIGRVCPRCHEPLHQRKPNSMTRSWALTIAAATLYAPSNLFPIMHVRQLTREQSYTIYGGLQELVKVGLWPLAVLVFCASIAIPVFKLLALSVMLIQTRTGSARHLANRARLYRVIVFIGRWSMVDVFVVSILVAMVRFGWLTQITADWGAVYFASVVVLTMLAVESFDPRLMWDAARDKKRFHLAKTAPLNQT